STPATVVSALTAAARRGLLLKGGQALESARKLRAIALDKTGTLTDPHPALERIDTFGVVSERDALAIAAALERGSGHPL
ncbi:UNVERIFIED_CONTAM: cation-translocating P-type ATPase, partial [Salmonella enterica subsp. enterica serovar Weltevreden]